MKKFFFGIGNGRDPLKNDDIINGLYQENCSFQK